MMVYVSAKCVMELSGNIYQTDKIIKNFSFARIFPGKCVIFLRHLEHSMMYVLLTIFKYELFI